MRKLINHKINLLANVMQYRSIRDVADELWDYEDGTASLTDINAVRDINKYIADNEITFDQNNQTDMNIEAFVLSSIEDFLDPEVNINEDNDLKALEVLVSCFGADEKLRRMYTDNINNIKPLFKDKIIAGAIRLKFKSLDEMNIDGVLSEGIAEQEYRNELRKRYEMENMQKNLKDIEDRLARALALRNTVKDHQKIYMSQVVSSIEDELFRFRRDNGLI